MSIHFGLKYGCELIKREGDVRMRPHMLLCDGVSGSGVDPPPLKTYDLNHGVASSNG